MLRASPELRPVVLHGAVVAAPAEPRLVELLQRLGGQEGREKERAVPDMAEGASLLVE
jgi:hypothetical protein